jgi:hypothetical protein
MHLLLISEAPTYLENVQFNPLCMAGKRQKPMPQAVTEKSECLDTFMFFPSLSREKLGAELSSQSHGTLLSVGLKGKTVF